MTDGRRQSAQVWARQNKKFKGWSLAISSSLGQTKHNIYKTVVGKQLKSGPDKTKYLTRRSKAISSSLGQTKQNILQDGRLQSAKVWARQNKIVYNIV